MGCKKSAKPTAVATSHHGHENITVGPDGTRYRTAQEGMARIFVPLSEGDKTRQNGGGGPAVEDHAQQVFYNPIQQFNRDLSVLAIKAYGQARLQEREARFLRKKEAFASKKRKRQTKPGEGQIEDQIEDKVEGERQETTGTENKRPVKKQKEVEASPTDSPTEAATDKADKADKSNEADNATEENKANESSPVPPLRILDALSATGLRALRYAHELPFPVAVTANDLLAAATESIRRNVQLNGLQDKIVARQSDALAHMYTVVAQDLKAAAEAMEAPTGADNKGKERRAKGPPRPRGPSEKYDVIDLDPYGTAATFLDAAVQAVRNDGGLLCVTCTDAGVWASQGYPEKCYALYGGVPMKGSHSHEAGLRLVLHALGQAAARYGLAIEPQLSLYIDFYCRVFVTVSRSPASVKFLAGQTMAAYNCDQGCGAWTTQPLLRNRVTPNKNGSGTFYRHTFAAAPLQDGGRRCPHCRSQTHLAGPMYAGPLHSSAFIQRILDDLPHVSTEVYGTTGRIRGMLQTALEEVAEDDAAPAAPDGQVKKACGLEKSREDRLATLDPTPFFFIPTNLAKAVHCATPNEDAIRGALLHLGYRVARSHCRPGSIKTDAPWSVLWEIMREWVRQKAPIKPESIRPGTAAYELLRMGGKEEKPPTAEGDDEQEKTESGQRLEVVFDEQLGHRHAQRGGKLVRYQINPRENWGPMNRARGH